MLAKAQSQQEKYDVQRKIKNDKNVTTQPKFQVGDIIRYHIYDANKLSPQWSEPYKIIRFEDDFIIKIVCLSNKTKFRTCNTDHVKLASKTHIPDLETIAIKRNAIPIFDKPKTPINVTPVIPQHMPNIDIDMKIDASQFYPISMLAHNRTPKRPCIFATPQPIKYFKTLNIFKKRGKTNYINSNETKTPNETKTETPNEKRKSRLPCPYVSRPYTSVLITRHQI